MAHETHQRFSDPQEELAHLQRQVEETQRRLAAREAREVPVHEAAEEVVRAYAQVPPERVLSAEYRADVHEIGEIILDLPPDEDDEAVGELLGIVQRRGVKNALSVVAKMGNPHLEDDFHRALVRYLAEGYTAKDVREGTPLWDELHMTLFEVMLPKVADEKERAGPSGGLKERISVMEQFYAGMLSIADPKTLGKRHFSIELAVAESAPDIVLYLAVPTDRKELFQKHVGGLFPDARLVEQKADYNIFVRDGEVEVASARLKEDPILPLKTYEEFDHDPLNVMINVFSKLADKGEGASFQMVIRPVGDRYTKRYLKVAEKMEKGKALKEALKDTPDHWTGEIAATLREVFFPPKGEKDKKDEGVEDKGPDHTTMELVRKKLAAPVVAANVRVAVSTHRGGRARALLHEILSSFNQFDLVGGNGFRFVPAPPRRKREAVRAIIFRRFLTAEALPLSLREAASLMHFPDPALIHASPEFRQSKSAEVAPPLSLPQEGTLLGVNEFRGRTTRVYLTTADRMRHLYVIGQTGTGKSVFLVNLCVQDILQGHGVCFIDPHGNDVQDVLAAVPPKRHKDVVYFDPSYMERVMGLNMLEYDQNRPEQKTFVINELFSIFRKLYRHIPESMGPAFEQYFRNATALVLEHPESGNTLLDVSRVLSNEAYRNLKLSHCRNPVVRQFWEEIATKAGGEASLANIVPYITNKFDVFTANDIMRPIIAQQKSSFNFREMMDTRKIFLVNLSKGLLGDINAHLLGLILVGKFLMAALSRVDMVGEKPPFFLYIDEFQNVTTDSISAIFSEARKYALSLTVAHQYLAQLEEGIRDSVFGNVGSLTAFRVGSEDAQFLEKHFAPTFSAHDLMNIDNYHCYVRLLARGVPQDPFNIRTLPPPQGDPETAEKLKQLSYLTYGTPRAEVEERIRAQYGL